MRTEAEIRADAADEQPFSNASEHDLWAARFCYNDCVHDDSAREIWCPIITVALAGRTGRPSWPVEWTREQVPWTDSAGAEHVYERVDACTEFEQRDDSDDGPAEPVAPPVEVDGQIELVVFPISPAGAPIVDPVYRGKAE